MAAPKGKAFNYLCNDMKNSSGQSSKVTQKTRTFNGEKVQAIKYVGRNEGHGTYMAGAVSGELVRDKNNRPVAYKYIGELV